MKVYLKPMLQKNLLTQDDAHNIFSNLDYKIAKIHVKFMQDLLARMEEWKQITNPHSQFVGDIFLDFVSSIFLISSRQLIFQDRRIQKL